MGEEEEEEEIHSVRTYCYPPHHDNRQRVMKPHRLPRKNNFQRIYFAILDGFEIKSTTMYCYPKKSFTGSLLSRYPYIIIYFLFVLNRILSRIIYRLQKPFLNCLGLQLYELKNSSFHMVFSFYS